MKCVTAKGIPYLSFCGYSGSGKTTLLSRLLPLLKEQGLRVAVVKHDGHTFEMDRPGTDTWKFAQAGADAVAIVSGSKIAYIEKIQKEPAIKEILEGISGVDLILIEGYKREKLPKILVSRKGIPAPEHIPAELVLAETAEEKDEYCKDHPVFGCSEIRELCDFILMYMQS